MKFNPKDWSWSNGLNCWISSKTDKVYNDKEYKLLLENHKDLRDTIAIAAMQGYITAWPDKDEQQIAIWSYKSADAMLQEREKQQS